MKIAGCIRKGMMLGAMLAPAGMAEAASCPVTADRPVFVGTVVGVEPGLPQAFSLTLKEGEGVIIDLANVSQAERGALDGENVALPRNLAICDTAGTLLAPMPGEVFEKGGSLSTTEDGERLRFMAPADGEYLVAVSSAEVSREILVRHRDVGVAQKAVMEVLLGGSASGEVSSAAPVTYSFEGAAGNWVELRATSDKDTVLRLAGPGRDGTYSVMGENDDGDGINPVLRRQLRATGTYFVQVASLDDDPGEFKLTAEVVDAPKPPPAPTALGLGTEVSGKLDSDDAVAVYSMTVVAGHNYRLDLTTPYDGVISIGLANPLAADDGGDFPDASFSEVKTQDANLTGKERLSFTARNNGTLLVRIKSFGLDGTEGDYTLSATDLGL